MSVFGSKRITLPGGIWNMGKSFDARDNVSPVLTQYTQTTCISCSKKFNRSRHPQRGIPLPSQTRSAYHASCSATEHYDLPYLIIQFKDTQAPIPLHNMKSKRTKLQYTNSLTSYNLNYGIPNSKKWNLISSIFNCSYIHRAMTLVNPPIILLLKFMNMTLLLKWWDYLPFLFCIVRQYCLYLRKHINMICFQITIFSPI